MRNFIIIFLLLHFFSCTSDKEASISYEEIVDAVLTENNAFLKTNSKEVVSQINEFDSLGNTLLHQAVIHKKQSQAKLLLSFGADPNLRNNSGNTPLDLARKNQDEELVKVIHELQYKNWKQNGRQMDQTRLEDAVINNNLLIIKEFVSSNIKVHEMELSNEFSPLVTAIFANSTDVALFLLENGANPNDEFDTRPVLCMAAMFQQKEIVESLIQKGADINKTDGTKTSALIFATEAGDKEIVNLLLANNAIDSLKNIVGETAYDVAIKKGYKEIGELLSTSENP